jgi:hypothetical protein
LVSSPQRRRSPAAIDQPLEVLFEVRPASLPAHQQKKVVGRRAGGPAAPSGSAARTAPRPASTSSSPGWARTSAGEFAWRSWTCGRRPALPRSRRAAPKILTCRLLSCETHPYVYAKNPFPDSRKLSNSSR